MQFGEIDIRCDEVVAVGYAERIGDTYLARVYVRDRKDSIAAPHVTEAQRASMNAQLDRSVLPVAPTVLPQDSPTLDEWMDGGGPEQGYIGAEPDVPTHSDREVGYWGGTVEQRHKDFLAQQQYNGG